MISPKRIIDTIKQGLDPWAIKRAPKDFWEGMRPITEGLFPQIGIKRLKGIRTVFLQRPGSTPNVSTMYSMLKNLGRDVIDLGQGSEVETMPRKLRRLFKYSSQPHPEYHNMDQLYQVNKSVAGFLRRFAGLPATSDSTLFMEKQGRDALMIAFLTLAQPFKDKNIKPAILMPNKRWSVIDALLKAAGVEIVEYDVQHPDPVQAKREALENHPDPNIKQRLMAEYDCYPNNPTGLHGSADLYARADKQRKEWNKETGRLDGGDLPPIASIHDDPYLAACYTNEDNEKEHFLNTGYEGLRGLKKQVASDRSHTIVITSFSKIFEMANNGATGVFIANSDLMKRYKNMAAVMGGLSYSKNRVKKITKALSGKYDDLIKKHIKKVGDRYGTLRAITKNFFPLVNGDRNMTILAKVSKDVIGKVVDCPDGKRRKIRNGDDFIQYAANMKKGVVAVFEAVSGDYLEIRLACKNKPKVHEDAAERLKLAEETALKSAVFEKPFTVKKALLEAGNTESNGEDNGKAKNRLYPFAQMAPP